VNRSTSSRPNPRTIAALGLMVRASGWAEVRLADGQKFYGFPSRSRPHLLHLADTQSCTCENHKRRDIDCAHILAVRLHCAQVRAKAALRTHRPRYTPEQVAVGTATYAAMFGGEA
jgi:hypothetical protein